MLAEVKFDDHEGAPIARVRGEIDTSNVRELGTTLRNAVAHSAPGLIVDFSETQYLDSAGVAFVFELGKRLRDRGQRLYLVAPPESPVSSVLAVVNVDALAPRCESLEHALERLRDHAADVPAP